MIPNVTTQYETCAGQKEESIRFVNPDGLSEEVSIKKSLPRQHYQCKECGKRFDDLTGTIFPRAPSTSQSLDFVPLLHGIEPVQ